MEKDMAESTSKINIIELLMGIKEDVSSIKTDMANFKEAQRTEREMILHEIQDVRADYKRDLAECSKAINDLETKFMAKANNLQTVQNNLVGDVDTLKHAEESKYAKRYKVALAFIATGLGGMFLGNLPEIIALWIKASGK
jgi:hypothetical protein